MAEDNGKAGKPLFADPFEGMDETSLLDFLQDDEGIGDREVHSEATPAFEHVPAAPLPRSIEHEPPEAQLAPETSFSPPQPEPAAGPAPQEEDAGGFLLESLIADIDDRVSGAIDSEIVPGVRQSTSLPERALRQYVVFRMAGTDYAVHIDNLTEIGTPLKVTPVPHVPSWVLGVTNLRGEIISMVDLAKFFGIESNGSKGGGRMMVARTRSESMKLGMIVERVDGIRSLPTDSDALQGAPAHDPVAPYLVGVCEEGGRVLGVLDFDRLLQSEQMRDL